MKPGQLVMLISHGGLFLGSSAVPIGSVGEILEFGPYLHETAVGSIPVDFPNHRSDAKSGFWSVPTSWLIPINDPDIDLSEETEGSLNEGLVLVD